MTLSAWLRARPAPRTGTDVPPLTDADREIVRQRLLTLSGVPSAASVAAMIRRRMFVERWGSE